MNRVLSKGNRSDLVDQAVKHLTESIGSTNLTKRLKKGALARARRDLEIAREWSCTVDNVRRRRTR
jgi:CopG family transcriptional regulator / antitoxin EndoAI